MNASNTLRGTSSVENLPGDDIDAPRLEGGPARLLDVGRNLRQLVSGELARPVSFDGLFDLAVCT